MLCRVSLSQATEFSRTVVMISSDVFLSLGYAGKISQMPVILTPLHFDRDPLQKQPSCQRSVVIRTFITSDFMTGVPATPGNEIPVEVIDVTFSNIHVGASRYIVQ